MHITDALVHVPPFAIAYKNQLKLVIFTEKIRMYMYAHAKIYRPTFFQINLIAQLTSLRAPFDIFKLVHGR